MEASRGDAAAMTWIFRVEASRGYDLRGGSCGDADPAVLAEYVRELLRKEDKSDAELREYCRDSLTDFLSGETDAFVESLFDAIASGEQARLGE